MARGKAPFVALRTDIRKEERVRFTADFAGYNEFEALGRYAALWCWCTDRGLEDAPDDCDGYAVPDAVVRRFLGPRGVEAILGDGCDELAMGERRPDLLIYLRGTSDTVDRLRSLRSSAMAGGDASKKVNVRGSGGRFVARATHVQLTDHQLASHPPPAASEIPDPRSQIPDPEIPDLSHHAHAIPPVPAQQAHHVTHVPTAIAARDETLRDPKPSNVIQVPPILPGSIARADARRRVINAAWQVGGEAFRALGAEGIDPGAFDPWAGLPSATSEGMKLLGARVDELLIGEPPNEERALEVIRRRVEVAKAEGRHAKDGPTRQWLTPMRLWDPVSFAKGAERSPEQVRPRAGPQGSAVRAPEPPRKITTLSKPSKPRSTP